jgi:hypothetical protein
MKRKQAFAALLLAVTLTLTACSPPFIGTVGIQRRADGSLGVLIRLCRGSLNTLTLQAVNSYPSAENGEPLSNAWEAVDDSRTRLSTQVNGEADLTAAFNESELRSDVLYHLWGAGRDGNAFSGLFSAGDLAAVNTGEVLAEPSRDSLGVHEIMTPREFEAFSEEFCS